MAGNYTLVAAAENTLRERLFSSEFHDLPLFQDHPEWLSDLYSDLNALITEKLSNAELEESIVMTDQVSYEVNSLLDEVVRSSGIERFDPSYNALFGDIKRSFCPRFPIC